MTISGIPNFTTESLKTVEGLSELNRIIQLINDNIAGNTDTVRVYDGFATPEGAITAGIGSLFMRLDGSTGTTIYIKESGIEATGWVAIAQLSTPVSLANGGTGQSLSDPGADRLFFWDDSAGVTDFLTPGDGLFISGTTIIAETFSNVIFSWKGFDGLTGAPATTSRGIAHGTSQILTGVDSQNVYWVANTNNSTSYSDIIPIFKWKKVSGINTLIVRVRTWGAFSTATSYTLRIDAGGQTGTSSAITGSSPAWITEFTVDVSSLSDGTVYDVKIQRANVQGAGNITVKISSIQIEGS